MNKIRSTKYHKKTWYAAIDITRAFGFNPNQTSIFCAHWVSSKDKRLVSSTDKGLRNFRALIHSRDLLFVNEAGARDLIKRFMLRQLKHMPEFFPLVTLQIPTTGQ